MSSTTFEMKALDVTDNFKYSDGSQGTGKVLISDANGNASWAVTGQTGSTGPQGSQGPEGPIGSQGVQGPQGIQGVTGYTGPAGAVGPQGTISIGGAVSGGTSGSVLFIDPTGNLSQDNTNFRYNSSSNQITMGNGVAGNPAYSFKDELGTGIWRNGTNSMRFDVGTVGIAQVSGEGVRIATNNRQFLGQTNTAGTPSYSFVSDIDTGMYYDGSAGVAFASGGVRKATINGSGLSLVSGATVASILDEDNMASNSATALATQQSIKAYVDNSITASIRSLISATGPVSYDNTTGVIDSTNIDTDDVIEASNLYYTDSRARTALSATGPVSYDSTSGLIDSTNIDTDDVIEASNLYYTDSRVDTWLGTKTTDDLLEGTSWKYWSPNYISGTTNQINTAGVGPFGVVLSTPQDIHSGATPTFSQVYTTQISATGSQLALGYDGSYNIILKGDGINHYGLSNFHSKIAPLADISNGNGFNLLGLNSYISIDKSISNAILYSSDTYHRFAGNVGIGTAPSGNLGLHVYKNQIAPTIIQVENPSSLGFAQVICQSDTDTLTLNQNGSGWGDSASIATTSNTLTLTSAGGTITLDGSGLGIGTAPSKKFHVLANVADHSAWINNTHASGYGLIVSATNDPLRVGTKDSGSGEFLMVNSSGKVGVGGSPANDKFEVHDGDMRIKKSVGKLQFTSSPNQTNAWHICANISDSADYGLLFGTGTTVGSNTKMLIDTAMKLYYSGSEQIQLQPLSGSGNLLFQNGSGAINVTGSYTLSFLTNNTTRLAIDSGGNVGINGSVTIGNHTISNTDSIELNAGGSGNRYAFIDFHGDDTYTDYGLRIIRANTGPNTTSGIAHRGTGALAIDCIDAGSIVMSTSSTVRMTLNSSGYFRFHAYGAGTLTTDSSGNVTAQVSDAQIKNSIEYFDDLKEDSLTKVNQLKPCRFKLNSDPYMDYYEGFIAQDVETVLPQAVDGKKHRFQPLRDDEDNVIFDDEGNMRLDETQPRYRSLNQTNIIAHLVKAVQQLTAKVEELESKINS